MGAVDLRAVFGAAFAALYGDGVLHSVTTTDDGLGGFAAARTDTAVKVLVDGLSDTDRAAGGLPRSAVRLTVLRAGLAASIALDDVLSTGGSDYRVIGVETDPAGATFALVAVPVAS